MPETPYLIHRRNIMLGLSQPKEKEKPKPIAKRSEKMKKEMKIYIPAMKAYLAKPENKYCQIKMEGCTHLAVTVHHVAGRTGVKLHDQEDWTPSCASCNFILETKDMEAREKGVKKSKFKV